MSDPKFKRLRVLHLVGGDNQTAPNALLLPLLMRGNRQRVDSHVVNFVRGSAQFAVVRQSGIPVHELPISDEKFSPSAVLELKALIKKIDPDVIHAWGSSAHVAAMGLSGGKGAPPVVWSIARTTPLSSKAGMVEKFVFGRSKSYAAKTDRIVYASAAAAAQHRRAGFPEKSIVISPGVDADRFRPDPAARERVRKQLELPPDALVVGMYAPFQPEFDHGTLLKAVGELIRTNQHLYCVLAGRGIVRGNAALMAMVGGGTLGTRTKMIGEWSDLGALFNACDVVCSTATTDVTRLALTMSMLCGVMCVATGVGAQGEIIGNFGVVIEQGSPDAMAKGIRRILEMPADRHAFMAREARKHAWQNFNNARSIDKYHELYMELVTGEEVKLTNDKLDAVPDFAIIARPTPSAPKPAEEPTPVPTPVIAEPEPVQPAKPDTLAADLDALLSKQGDALARGPDASVKHAAQDNVMEWSEDDAKLIENVMVEADTAILKAIDIKAAPVRSSESKAAKVVEEKSAEQKAAERRLLEARRAELTRAETMMRKAAIAAPKPAETKPPVTVAAVSAATASEPAKVATPKPPESQPQLVRTDAKPELKLVETKSPDIRSPDTRSIEAKSLQAGSAAAKGAETPPELKLERKPEPAPAESKAVEIKLAETKAAEFTVTELKTAELKTAELKATEPKVTEPQVAETETAEAKVEEIIRAPEPQAETKTTEIKIAENKAAEVNVTETKVAEPTAVNSLPEAVPAPVSTAAGS